MLQVVAMIFKRGALDKSKDGCGDLLKNVSHLLQSGDKDMVGFPEISSLDMLYH